MISYSKIVDKYASFKEDVFLIPDDIMLKDGVACGDVVTLLGEKNEEIIEFKFSIEGCELCKASANYLFEKYNNKRASYIIESLEDWLKKIENNNNVLLNFFEIENLEGRFQCLYSPIEMLFSFVNNLNNLNAPSLKKADTSVKLECDACVVSSSVNWAEKKENMVERELEREYSTEYKEKWGKCSKLYLNNSEVSLLKKLNDNITTDDYSYLRKEKMAMMLYNNLLKNNIDVKRNPIWKDVIYRIHRKYIVQVELDKIYKSIFNEDLKIYPVKGANSSSLYEEDEIRVNLDYDFVATSSKDAFKLANSLINDGFMIMMGVFSLKKIKVNDKDIYSGHIHLQKILNSQYRIVLDVHFPGYPMARVDLFYPTIKYNKIIDEDQFIITMCHAYKHRNVYMKDINDMYKMIKKKNLDFSIIKRRLDENNLNRFASLLLGFIFSNYDLDENKKELIKNELDLNISLYKEEYKWPYNESVALSIKKQDLSERLSNGEDISRLHLFPITIFKEFFDLDKHEFKKSIFKKYNITILQENIIKVEIENILFVIIGIGIFVDAYADVSHLGRKRIRQIVVELLSDLKIRELIEVPYALDMMDKWYF